MNNETTFRMSCSQTLLYAVTVLTLILPCAAITYYHNASCPTRSPTSHRRPRVPSKSGRPTFLRLRPILMAVPCKFLLQWVHGLLSSTYLLHHFAHDTMYSPLHLSWCKLLSFGKVCQDQSIPPKRSAVRVISVVVHQIVDHVLSPDFLFSVGRMGFLLTLRFNTRLLPSKKLKYIDNVVRHIGVSGKLTSMTTDN